MVVKVEVGFGVLIISVSTVCVVMGVLGMTMAMRLRGWVMFEDLFGEMDRFLTEHHY